MLQELHLQNYRCFDDHKIPFQPQTIIVGRNNAGKSTIIEALRIVAVVVNKYQNLNFQDAPRWLNIPLIERGVSPSLKNLEINFDSIFYRYGTPPAILKALFIRGENITIYIGDGGKIHAIIKDRTGNNLLTKGQAAKINLPKVSILPQIGPLLNEEKVLSKDYVKTSASSHLASLHFRNQINFQYELFRKFKKLAESSWDKLRIRSFDGRSEIPGKSLSLFVQDGDFVAEVGWMGHGLQMWLQTMWFLTRSEGDDTVILDEPDVYLHADLQKKLIRFIQGRNNQIIIATHSTEIIMEIEPDNVLIIDRRLNSSKFANSIPELQKLVNYIGSTYNLQLTRLWNSRRLLLIEGKDIKILKLFHAKFYPASHDPLDTIPNFPIGGWGGWNYVVGSKMLLKNAGGEEIITYCILDSDYHTGDEIQKRLQESKKYGIQLHIWKRKEIENYFLVPQAIRRVILSNTKVSPSEIDNYKIVSKIDSIAEILRNDTFDSIANEFHHHQKLDNKNSNKKAREIIDKAWETFEGRLSIISGKAAISMIAQWAQEEFHISFGISAIAKEIRPEEISQEVRDIVKAIECNNRF